MAPDDTMNERDDLDPETRKLLDRYFPPEPERHWWQASREIWTDRMLYAGSIAVWLLLGWLAMHHH